MDKIDFKKSILILFISNITSLFVFCEAQNRKISNDIVKFNENSENGLIVGSVTFPQVLARFNAYFPKITSLDNGKSKEFIIQPNGFSKLKHWGELQDGRTYLFAITKAPGNYEINTIRFSNVTSIGGIVIDSKSTEFSIPFQIKKGEITYIGEISLDEYGGVRDTLIRLKDEFERDIQRMKKKDFKIDWNKTKKSDLKILYK